MYSAFYKFGDSNRKPFASIQYSKNSIWTPTSTSDFSIQSFTLSSSIASNNCITMGTTNASTLNLKLIDVSETMHTTLMKGSRIKLGVGNEVDGTKYEFTVGIFHIDSIDWKKYEDSSNRYSANITLYDGFCKTDIKFTPPSDDNVTIRQCVSHIASLCGLGTYTNNWSSTITIGSYPEGITCRQMLGYLAGLQGTVAYINRNNQIANKWYTSCTKVIDLDEQYSDGLEFIGSSQDAESITIKNIQSGTGDTIYTGDSTLGALGSVISYENPLITQEQVTSIYNDKVYKDGAYQIAFTPMKVKWRGDLSIELGEIVKVVDKSGTKRTCYVMARDVNFDGGLSETYTCYGENETTLSFSANPTMRTINRKLSVMEEAIEDATDAINNVIVSDEGIFKITKSTDGEHNTGWIIKGGGRDAAGNELSEGTSSSDNVIIANANGIGFSSNGGQSMNAAAIYIDSVGEGHINGKYITANSINTDSIVIGSSNDVNSLTYRLNNMDDASVPLFYCTGSTNAAVRKFCTIDSAYKDSFKIENGAMIRVRFTKTAVSSSGTANELKLTLFKTYTTSGSSDLYNKSGGTTAKTETSEGPHTLDANVDIPIYYNGSALTNTGGYAWGAGDTVTFCYNSTNSRWDMEVAGLGTANNARTTAGTALSTANSASSTASSAVSTANTASSNASTALTTINGLTCDQDNVTVINGGKIYTGSIEANKITGNSIKAGTITISHLSVGESIRVEMFKDAVIGDYAKTEDIAWFNYRVTAREKATLNVGDQMLYRGASEDAYTYGADISQYIFLENGKSYQLSTYMEIWDAYSASSNSGVGLVVGGTYYMPSDESYVYPFTNKGGYAAGTNNYNRRFNAMFRFKYTGESGLQTVGIAWKGIKPYDATKTILSPASFRFISLVEIGDLSVSNTYGTHKNPYFYSDEKALLSSDALQSTNKITTSRNKDYYNKTDALTIDDGGNLNTLGKVQGTSGRIGSMNFSENKVSIGGSVGYASTEHRMRISSIEFNNELSSEWKSSSLFDTRNLMCGLKFQYQDGEIDLKSGGLSDLSPVDYNMLILNGAGIYLHEIVTVQKYISGSYVNITRLNYVEIKPSGITVGQQDSDGTHTYTTYKKDGAH